MVKIFRSYKREVGLPPGTMIEMGKTDQPPIITVLDYDDKTLLEKKVEDIAECLTFKDKPSVSWINVEGIDPDVIMKLDEFFGVHPLVAEDIVITGQRPKMEDYGNYIFMVFSMIYFDEKRKEIIDEQVSLIFGSNFVISFQEKEGDVFDPIRARIREAKGRVRAMGADYLAYCLLDAVIDNYFLVLEKIGNQIENLEEDIITHLGGDVAHRIHRVKRDTTYFRKQVWPLREVINSLQRNESRLLKKTTNVYLRDAYDHIIQVIDTVETFRDMLSGLRDVYLSAISNRLNEIMKVLTIFAAIFIPLTFIAGVYGMNFEFMPELKWRYGYFIVLAGMATVGLGLLAFFKRNKWL